MIRLFHGTSSRFINQIKRSGIQPRKTHGRSVYEGKQYGNKNLESDPNLIYLTDTYPVQFGQIAVSKFGGAVLVALVEVDENQLLPDTDFQYPGWKECLESCGTVALRAEYIRPIRLYQIDGREIKKHLSEIMIHAGIKHRAFGDQMRGIMDFLLMTARHQWDRNGDEWYERL